MISSRCKDATEPLIINLETILAPYLEQGDIENLRSIVGKVYEKKLRLAS